MSCGSRTPRRVTGSIPADERANEGVSHTKRPDGDPRCCKTCCGCERTKKPREHSRRPSTARIIHALVMALVVWWCYCCNNAGMQTLYMQPHCQRGEPYGAGIQPRNVLLVEKVFEPICDDSWPCENRPGGASHRGGARASLTTPNGNEEGGGRWEREREVRERTNERTSRPPSPPRGSF